MKNIINYIEYNTLNEGFFKDLVNSIFTKNKTKNTSKEIEEVKKVLIDNNIDNDEVFSLLDDILNHKNIESINLNILIRRLKNVLIKKGEKSKSILLQ